VNGPGEAREADLGIAAGRGKGVIFRRGEIVRHVSEEEMVDALMEEVAKWDAEGGATTSGLASMSPVPSQSFTVGSYSLPVLNS
jgi:hypothetical protein